MASKKEERQRRLVQLIKTEGKLPVRELANILSVTEMTIRRDFEELGTQYNPELASDLHAEYQGYDLLTALQKSNDTKVKIGKMAASLIRPDDIISIDTGSTTARMLPYLPENYNLTVLCYNTNVLFEIRYKDRIQPLFCGGRYHRNTEMFESPEGVQLIERTRINKAFLSAAGMHKKLGITCANDYEVLTKNAVIRSSLERILLVDSSKFNQVRSSYFCDLSDIHTVITDKGIADDWRELMREKGIALTIV